MGEIMRSYFPFQLLGTSPDNNDLPCINPVIFSVIHLQDIDI